MKELRLPLGCLFALIVASCAGQPDGATPPPHSAPGAAPSAAAERDEILMLLALAVAWKDWQTGPEPKRGYNIAAVLVDPDGKIVHWARNCNHATRNGTQHGELRLNTQYLSASRTYSLKGHSVYSTLEPCAQCAGTILMQRVARVVFAQSDPDFGKAMQRLALDSSDNGGYRPYPRLTPSVQSPSAIASELDRTFAASGASITDWLHSEEARSIFERGASRLRNYQVLHASNVRVLAESLDFLERQVIPEQLDVVGR